MVCLNCGNEFKTGNICPHCHSDAVLLNKARIASLKQYNKGVFFAKEGDYSAAIDSLSQCILFDKRNYVARNLLGISYYQIGLVGEALKQWIISDNTQGEKNPARKYIDALQKNGRSLEKWNDAICMYNKALTQFKSGSDDLAVIGLKKAVDFNPNFVDALNLLSVYYIGKGDKQKAKNYVDKALTIDKRNPKSLEYLAEITSADSVGDKRTTTGTGYNDKAVRKPLKNYVRLEVVAFIAGIIVTSAIAAALVVPGIQSGLVKKVDSLEETIARLEDENTNGTSKFAIRYSELEEENAILKAENEQYKATESNKQQTDDLQMALAYSVSGNNLEAAKLLKNLTVENFSDSDQEEIANLKELTYPDAARYFFEQGQSLFSAGNSNEAEASLVTALEYGNKEDFIDDALYLLGEINESKGDNEQAKEYYGRVINEFADSNVFSQAEEKLNILLSNG